MGDGLVDTPRTCAECRAPSVVGLSCWEQLNLQHPAQFTEAALANLRSALIDRLDKGVAVEELRRRAARRFEGKARVLKPASERQPVPREWGMTIADVYIREHPEGAADRVRTWAASIRRELC